MTARVCYLSRADRGARIAAARVVGGRLDEQWVLSGTENGAADPLAEVAQAAAWVGDRLAQGDEGGGRRLRFLCLDADGARCSWLTAPSADAKVVAAAMFQGDAGGAEGEGEARSTGGGGAWDDLTTGEATLQALATPEGRPRRRRRGADAGGPQAGRRLAAMAVPDVTARLFLDALDDRGVSADAVVSIWHALGAAWDPGGAAGASVGGLREDRVVATATPPSAIVVIDPEGRLIWSWSRAGELLAAGTIRLVGRGGSTVEDGVRIADADVGRLTADWLAWAAQLGVVPSRIVCIGPGVKGGVPGLTPERLGEALGRAWPGATVDLAVHDDPIGATLHRLADLPAHGPQGVEDPRTGLVPLSNRPARVHRSLLRWAALALLLGAAGLVGVAWRAWAAASEIRARAAQAREETDAAIVAVLPAAARDAWPEKLLEGELAKLRAARDAGKDIDAAKPILQELDVISAVLTPDTKPESITLLNTNAMVSVTVPSLEAGNDLVESIKSIGGSSCDWREGEFTSMGDKYRFHLVGAWRVPAAGKGGGP